MSTANLLNKTIALVIFLVLTSAGTAQSVLGLWKNIDDEDGEAKSHIEVYEEDGKLYGRVKKLLPKATLMVCTKCKGERKDQPIEGMLIMWDLKQKGEKWEGGKIIDPKKGKVYGCKIELDGEDVLKVRGYLKFSVFGRTQKWYRVKTEE